MLLLWLLWGCAALQQSPWWSRFCCSIAATMAETREETTMRARGEPAIRHLNWWRHLRCGHCRCRSCCGCCGCSDRPRQVSKLLLALLFLMLSNTCVCVCFEFEAIAVPLKIRTTTRDHSGFLILDSSVLTPTFR